MAGAETIKPLAEEETRALSLVLDGIIPPSEDGRMPGAGTLGIEALVHEMLRNTPDLEIMIRQSLLALANMALESDPRGMDALSGEQRTALLAKLAASEHAVPPVLMLQAYAAYYQHPRVLAALGAEARAPHPQGYAMKENDDSLLDPVRKRKPIYRMV